MGIITLIGQILLGVPFVVFAYWYHREEALFRGTRSPSTPHHTLYWHGAFGLFFSFSFAALGLLFFPPVTMTIVLLACIYVLIRALDNIDHDRSVERASNTATPPI
jgi:hypothetical protein